MNDIRERLRETIVSDAYEERTLTSYGLAERLIRERKEAAVVIDKLVEALKQVKGISKLESVHDYSRGWNGAKWKAEQISRAALAAVSEGE